MVYVPYKGSRLASVTDLLAGETQFTIDGLTGLYPLIQDGRLRPLAVGRAQRWPQLPDVLTLVESGLRISPSMPGPRCSHPPARRG